MVLLENSFAKVFLTFRCIRIVSSFDESRLLVYKTKLPNLLFCDALIIMFYKTNP